MRYAHPDAGRYDHLHGDEDWGRELTPSEEVEIEQRASELVKERLADHRQFYSLMEGIDSDEIDPHLHRMQQNYHKARNTVLATFGLELPPALEGFFAAFEQIDRAIRREADVCWRDECTTEAELIINHEASND